MTAYRWTCRLECPCPTTKRPSSCLLQTIMDKLCPPHRCLQSPTDHRLSTDVQTCRSLPKVSFFIESLTRVGGGGHAFLISSSVSSLQSPSACWGATLMALCRRRPLRVKSWPSRLHQRPRPKSPPSNKRASRRPSSHQYLRHTRKVRIITAALNTLRVRRRSTVSPRQHVKLIRVHHVGDKIAPEQLEPVEHQLRT